MVRSHGPHVCQWRHSCRVPRGMNLFLGGPGKEKVRWVITTPAIWVISLLYEDQAVLWYCGADLFCIYLHKSVCFQKGVHLWSELLLLCFLFPQWDSGTPVCWGCPCFFSIIHWITKIGVGRMRYRSIATSQYRVFPECYLPSHRWHG